MQIELFNVRYRPHAGEPEIQLLCQSVGAEDDRLLWVDGINAEQPVLVPLANVKGIEPAGTFREFMAQRLKHAALLFEESQGEHSPTILARAAQIMSLDPRLSAPEALDQAVEQAVDIVDADNMSALAFSRVAPQAMAA